MVLSDKTSLKAPLKKFKADKPLFSIVLLGILRISEQITLAEALASLDNFSILVKAVTLADSLTVIVVTSWPLFTVNLNTSDSLPLNSSIVLCFDVSISLYKDSVEPFESVRAKAFRFSLTFALFLFALFLFAIVFSSFPLFSNDTFICIMGQPIDNSL